MINDTENLNRALMPYFIIYSDYVRPKAQHIYNFFSLVNQIKKADPIET